MNVTCFLTELLSYPIREVDAIGPLNISPFGFML